MPLHKKIKLLVEIQVPETRENFSPSQWLHAGTHVQILNMQKLEVSDVVIQPKINERQRAFNEYKRVLQEAVNKTQFEHIIKLRNFGTKSISIMVPGNWNRHVQAFTLTCENTTFIHEEWIRMDLQTGGPNKVVTKFELGKPTVIDDLAQFIDQRLTTYKKDVRVSW